MDGGIKNLSEFMRGSSRFYIPVYQRNYDWHIDNCKRLLEDLVTTHKEKRKTHFFGSLVVKPGSLHQETIIIDGQQRLTTVSLLLLAIGKWLKDNELEDRQINLEKIINTFLIDEWAKPGNNYRLESNPKDFEAYKKLFDKPKYYIESSNITRNYHYFYDQLEHFPISISDLLDAYRKLEVMIVNLNSPEDDPQLIFESLNSTGLSLTDADRIRNFLLMDEEQTEQEFLFNYFWEPIEERTNYDVSEFFRYYLTLKLAKTPSRNQIYEVFRDYYTTYSVDKREFFEQLAEYAFAYQQILENHTGNRTIDVILYRFNQLEVTVIRPFLMAILRDYNEHIINEDEVAKILRIIENYIARRMITQTPSNALNKIMATLYRDLIKYHSEGIEPSEVIAFVLLNKQRSGYFPTDEDIQNSLEVRDMYNVNSKFRSYFFERLENTNHVETLNIYGGIESGDISVEHIMPQKLNSIWKKELGESYQEIHANYLNNLGNLTLTGYNSKYSNRPFKEKKNIEKGFNESHFSFLNQIPKATNEWGKEEIVKRRNQLIDQALMVWPMPETTYQPIESIEESNLYIYDGEETYTGYRIKGYIFVDEDYQEVTTWREMFIQVIKRLARVNPNKIMELASSRLNSGYTTLFTDYEDTRRTEIIPGIYLKTSISNFDKMNCLRQLFDLFDIDYSELQLDALAPKVES